MDKVWVVEFYQAPETSILNVFATIESVIEYYGQYVWWQDRYDNSHWDSDGALTAKEVDFHA